MPRSAGTYTLTANAHAVSGNTISSVAYNNLIDDLAAEMTNSMPRDGSAAMNAPFPASVGSATAPSYTFTGDLNTGLYRYAADAVGVACNGAAVGRFTSDGWVGNVTGQVNGGAYADVASATTTDIGAAASKWINITGTTTITGLGTVAAGTEKNIKFAGALTFTHNATSLILPGGANITTAAGDTAVAVSLGSGNWRVVDYTRASGLPIVRSPKGIAQIVTSQTGAVATGTTQLPKDDTIPQNTEGDEYMTLAITPQSATSTLIIDVGGAFDTSTNGMFAMALFQDSTANALKTTFTELATNVTTWLTLRHVMTSGTTSATTFKVRAGINAAGTTTFNGDASSRLYGGTAGSYITITEILP